MQTITLTRSQAEIIEYALCRHEEASRDIAYDQGPVDGVIFDADADVCNALRATLIKMFDLDV